MSRPVEQGDRCGVDEKVIKMKKMLCSIKIIIKFVIDNFKTN